MVRPKYDFKELLRRRTFKLVSWLQISLYDLAACIRIDSDSYKINRLPRAEAVTFRDMPEMPCLQTCRVHPGGAEHHVL